MLAVLQSGVVALFIPVRFSGLKRAKLCCIDPLTEPPASAKALITRAMRRETHDMVMPFEFEGAYLITWESAGKSMLIPDSSVHASKRLYC